MQKLRKLAEAALAYADEHDNRLPLAAVWQDALAPYLEGDKPFVCPDHPDEECSYAFHAALSETTLPSDWQHRGVTMLFACTGADTPNAVFTLADLKKLTGRHGRFNTVAMCPAGFSGQGLALPVGQSYEDLLAADRKGELCAINLRTLVEAARAYAKAHDSRLPGAATWCDDLAPLIKPGAAGGNAFTCPASPEAGCCYAINRALAGKRLKEMVNYGKLVLFLEVGPTQRNAAVDLGESYPGRHPLMWNPAPIYHEATLNGNVTNVAGKQP
jgi:hypothetical protein